MRPIHNVTVAGSIVVVIGAIFHQLSTVTSSAEHDLAMQLAGPNAICRSAPEAHANGAAGAGRTIKFYRNPMGLADVSPVPKKDQMGMDYIPVYAGEEARDPASVTLSMGRIQRSGVRTEVVEARVLVTPVRGVGTVRYDERRVTSVSTGVEGYAEDVYVGHVGKTVKIGEPLFRMASTNTQMLQIEIARRSRSLPRVDASAGGLFTGSAATAAADWPSPASGVVVEKRIVPGQRITMADEVFRIADTSRMWVTVDLAERDLARVKPGQRAMVSVRGEGNKVREGTVLFVYPEIRAETRSGRVAIEIANADGGLRAEMYAEVVVRAGADGDPVVAVADSALLGDETGSRVLVAKGDGRFEPRRVRLGTRGAGYAEVLDGVAEGETVVTSAAFLIDSEANLDAALAAFAAAGKMP